jgi:hypothetical protein
MYNILLGFKQIGVYSLMMVGGHQNMEEILYCHVYCVCKWFYK